MTRGELAHAHTGLVVDDEVETLEEIEEFLSLRGLKILTARSVDDALVQLETGCQIDFLVVDVRMPKRSGLELINHIVNRPDAATNRPAIFVVTGHAGIAEQSEAAALGATAFLRKPLDPNDLYGRIVRTVEE